MKRLRRGEEDLEGEEGGERKDLKESEETKGQSPF